MYNLTKPLTKPNQKNPNKSYVLNQMQIRKKPNINQIKEEIELILKRNNSPLSLNADKQIQRSQKHIHCHLLQKKKSKILQRANQQNIEKAKNNRKIYEEYLMGDFAAKSYSKTIDPKQNTNNFTRKQTKHSKQLQKDLSTQISNFNSSRTLELLKKQKNSQSMFTEKQIQHLGLGKLFFYKDSYIKLKRSNLLNVQTSFERRNIFKDTAIESFYHEPSLDITRYLKHFDRSGVEEDQVKVRKAESILARERSLEIFRKDIIPKESFSEQMILQANPEDLGVMGTLKNYAEHSQNQSRKSIKHEISPHFGQRGGQMRQILNVMDEQLLIYYGKIKGRKPSNHFIPSVTHRTILYRSGSKNNQPSSLSKILNSGTRTSMEIKKPLTKENSWRFQNFDPWEKHKPQDEMDYQHVFGALEEHTNSLQFEQSSQKIEKRN